MRHTFLFIRSIHPNTHTHPSPTNRDKPPIITQQTHPCVARCRRARLPQHREQRQSPPPKPNPRTPFIKKNNNNTYIHIKHKTKPYPWVAGGGGARLPQYREQREFFQDLVDAGEGPDDEFPQHGARVDGGAVWCVWGFWGGGFGGCLVGGGGD